MSTNPQPAPDHARCPRDGHLLDRAGKCWYCGGIYPVSRPALTVVNTEAQVEVEALETMTVDTETGEVQEPAGQMLLGDDPAFVRPTRRRDVPTVKVTFAGTVELEQKEFEALTDGKELAPGRVVYIRASAYMPGPHAAWVKRTEKDEDTGERESWWTTRVDWRSRSPRSAAWT